MNTPQDTNLCTFDTLKRRVALQNQGEDIALLDTAFALASEAYRGRNVAGGRPLLQHCLNVACILAEYPLDPQTIAAGLLHELLPSKRDTAELKKLLGDELFEMLELLSSLNVLRFSTDEKEQAQQLRQMFIAMARKVHTIVVKLANRLEIMRHLDLFPEQEREAYALETMEIFAPLAHRLGLSQMKSEIEDLAFKWTSPAEYAYLRDSVQALATEREETLQLSIREIKKLCRDNGVDIHITGRQKHYYSMYKKMLRQGIQVSELFDILAVRIIVETEEQCYRVLSLLHTNWTPVPGTFDDYIQEPKDNGYQSLHTVVVGPNKLPVEAQIRTWEMHQTAEYGVAAHWAYKEEVGGGRVADTAATWIRRVVDHGSETTDPRHFLEQITLDPFEDKVFVLTPKGRVVTLPKGATPVDAAYRIHTEIGHRCIGAMVNGRIATLDTPLHNGDVIEIKTSKTSRPSRDWLQFVRSAGARQKIRTWFKQSNRVENIAQGKEMLQHELDRAGLRRKDLIDRIGLQDSLKITNLKTENDLYAAIGCGDINVEGVVNRIRKKYRDLLQTEERDKPVTRAAPSVRRKKKDVIVDGLSDVLVNFSKCCCPLPGDAIVGQVSSGKGIYIHRANCETLKKTPKEKSPIVSVQWGGEAFKSTYLAHIVIHSLNSAEMLHQIMAAVSGAKMQISNMQSKVLKDLSRLTNLWVEVADAEQAADIVSRINRLDDVISAQRKI
jgi:GTP pyrophosphokinase